MIGNRHPLSIAIPAAGSFAVSALLLTALLSIGIGWHQSADPPTLTISSFALLKGVEDGAEDAKAAEQQPPNPAPTPPSRIAPQTPLPPVHAAPVPPPPIAVVTLAPSAQPVPTAATATPQPASSASAPALTAAASMATSAPARRGAADGLDADAPAGASRSYAARVRSWLYAHKLYPKRARMRREEGVVQVRFTIGRDGLLLNRQIISGSGHVTLDEEAFSMMGRASPYPRAPREIAGERIEFIAPVAFVLPI